VMGIVKEIKEKEGKKIMELEDLTTTVSIVFSDVSADLDDVVAVRAISAGKILYGKEIIYPDIPLRSPAFGRGKACFVSDLHLKEAPTADVKNFFKWFGQSAIKYLFIAGDVEDVKKLEEYSSELTGKKIFLIPGNMDTTDYPGLPLQTGSGIVSLSNPAMVEINGVKILLVHNFDINMLKKRYLGQSKDILPEDYLVLEDVPDIVHCGHTHKPDIKNYKSVTIVNSGSPLDEFRPVVVDFSSRNVEQVQL